MVMAQKATIVDMVEPETQVRSTSAVRPEQSGAIPWRMGESGLEVLLITSSQGTRWIVPKGWVEPGLTPAESALKEASEEAGVEGTLSPAPVGMLRYKRGDRMLDVEIYLLEVTRVHERWPEDFKRERTWLPAPEAAALASEPGLARYILDLAERLARRSPRTTRDLDRVPGS